MEEFDDALLIWDETTTQLHHFDLPAAMIWDALDGTRTLAQVAELLRADLRTSPQGLNADLLSTAARLVELDLVRRRSIEATTA